MSSHQTHLLARDYPTDRELVPLLGQLDDLLERLGAAESTWCDWVVAVDPAYRASARNIVHYWAIGRQTSANCRAGWLYSGCRRWVAVNPTSRTRASRPFRGGGNPGGHVASTRAARGRRGGGSRAVAAPDRRPTRTSTGDRETRIMVTLPSEAATNEDLVRGLVQRGMNVARINCAHDDPTAWRAMAEHVRHASAYWGAAASSQWTLGARSCAPGRSSRGHVW